MDQQIDKIIKGETKINFISNGLLNAICAALIFKSSPTVPVDFWSLFVDTTVTCIFISYLTTFFNYKSAKRYLNKGIKPKHSYHHWILDLPDHYVFLGGCLAGLFIIPLICIIGLLFYCIDVTYLSFIHFVIFKLLWSGIYGAIVAYIVLSHYLLRGDD